MQTLSHLSDVTAGSSRSTRTGTVLVVRHGDTKSAHLIGGWDETKLTQAGRKESQDGAKALASFPIERIYCSDLERARETAAYIQAENIGRPPITVTPSLRSWNLGYLTGEPQPKADPFIRAYELTAPNAKVPDGESFMDFLQRLLPYIGEIFQHVIRTGGTVAIVTHNRPSKILQVWVDAGCDLNKVKWKVMEDKGMDPGGAMKITVSDTHISREDF